MIKVPEENVPAGAIRTLLEALAQFTPPTAALAHIFGFIDPPEMERALATWRDETTKAVNDHEEMLRRLEAKITPRLRISQTALDIALWLANQSPDGLRHLIMFGDLAAAFPKVLKNALEEAAFELKHLNLVSCTATMGNPVRTVQTHYELFWAFDPTVHGTDPRADAVELAKLIVDDESLGSIPRLHERIGWSKRRLNPAVAYLMPHVAEGRTRKTITSEYPTIGFALNSEDRFRLRRFIEDEVQ